MEKILPRHSGSGEHVAPHRLATGPGAGDRSQTGDISVKLKRDRKRSVEEVIAEVRDKISERGAGAGRRNSRSFSQDMIGDLTSAPEPVVIKLFVPGSGSAEPVGAAVGDAIKKIPGVVDVLNGIENTISGPAHVFTVDPAVTARAGFSAAGSGAGRQRHSAGRTGLGAGGGERPLVHHPRALPARSAQGRWTPCATPAGERHGQDGDLGALANLVEDPGQTEIRRENLQRDVQVTARFEGHEPGRRHAQGAGRPSPI